MNEKNKDIINILDIILIVLKNIKLIIILPFCVFILTFAFLISGKLIPPDSVFNFFPDEYKSESKVLISLPGDSGGLLSSMAGQEIGALLGIMGQGTGSQDVGDFIKYLFELNEIRDKIIEDFHFKERYGIQKFPVTSSRNEFKERFSIKMNMEKTILTIGFVDTDPEFATDVLNTTVDMVVKKYGEISLKNVSKKLTFLKESLEVAEDKYMKAQDDFIAFQKESGIIDVSSQAKETIKYVAELQAKMVKLEMELKGLLEYFNEGDPKVVRKQKEIETIKQVMMDFEKGAGLFEGKFIPQDKLPQVTRDFLNLELELKIQAEIYKMLRGQYEAARIEELDTTARFQIIEKGEIPEKKDRPPRFFILVVSTFVAFIFAFFIALTRNFFERVSNQPGDKKKIGEIQSTLQKFPLFKRKKRDY